MKKIYFLFVCVFIAFSAFGQTPALLKDIYPGITNSRPEYLIKVGNFVFFAADDGVHGKELWKTDGTEAGTVLVKDIRPGASGAGNSLLESRANFNGTLYFRADDGIHGVELWKSDGTEAGTMMVKDIDPGSSGSYPGNLGQLGAVANGLLYFSARSSDTGYELWKSDGTESGTVLVKDINPGSADSRPSLFAYANGIVFFTAWDGVHGTELWKSDGTDAGTILVKDINPGTAKGVSETQGQLTNFNNTLYFAADDGIHGTEFWTSDGTEAGTVMVKDIKAGDATSSSSPYGLKVIGNTLYFSVTEIVYVGALWKSDGTAAGTVLVKELNTSSNAAYDINFTLVNDDIFFAAVDAFGNSVLWKTDGTEAGTVAIKSWPQSTQYFDDLTSFDGMLYFTTRDNPLEYTELWKSDGTEAGTVGFDLYPGTQGSNPQDLVVLNNHLLFAAIDLGSGRELWNVPGAVLPLSLLNFSARRLDNKIELSWQTANEVNTALFEIERSATSVFTKIGEVKAMNQFGHYHYRMYDEQPLPGSNFYRLKMTDIDGSFTYSTIASVDFNTTDQVRLSPNPAGNELNISNAGAYSFLQVIDFSGRIVWQQKISDAEVVVNIQKLIPGNYVLRLTGIHDQKTAQFVKQ